MLLDFHEVYKTYNPINPIRGIIHVGAYDGEERKTYAAHNLNEVIWFEAMSQTYDKLKENIKGMSGHEAHNVVLSDVDGTTTFNVTNNGRGNNSSSSILPLEKHAVYYPHVVVQEVRTLPCRRFDTFAKEKRIPMERFNFLNIDVQGAELHVIRGMGSLIDNFDYIMAEVNEEKLYRGGVLLPDLEAYLAKHSFELRSKVMTKYQWGDGLFVKSK